MAEEVYDGNGKLLITSDWSAENGDGGASGIPVGVFTFAMGSETPETSTLAFLGKFPGTLYAIAKGLTSITVGESGIYAAGEFTSDYTIDVSDNDLDASSVAVVLAAAAASGQTYTVDISGGTTPAPVLSDAPTKTSITVQFPSGAALQNGAEGNTAFSVTLPGEILVWFQDDSGELTSPGGGADETEIGAGLVFTGAEIAQNVELNATVTTYFDVSRTGDTVTFTAKTAGVDPALSETGPTSPDIIVTASHQGRPLRNNDVYTITEINGGSVTTN